MPWLIETALPVKFDERCAVCNDEGAVSSVTTEHQNVVGFVGIAWAMKNYQLQVPCGSRCARRFRTLRRASWSLLLLPWVANTALSLFGPDSLGPYVVALVAGAAVLNIFGYCGFAWQWWLLRCVRLVRVDGERATIAVRNSAYAARLGELNSAVPREVFWTG